MRADRAPRFRRVESAARLLGMEPRRTARAIAGTPRLLRERAEFERQARTAEKPFPITKLVPYFGDDESNAGVATGAYFHQDLYVAQRLFASAPDKHLDVGSRIDGFVAHVASFREIEVVDIRPLSTSATGIEFLQADVMRPDSLPENYADSVSCLNALEHFGLGRYGDPIAFDGHEQGFASLVRVCKPGGILYLSVPIGPLRVEFNAHRVFSVAYVLEMAEAHGLTTEGFAYIDDSGDLHAEVEIEATGVADDYGCYFGCGLFEFGHPA